MIYNEFHDKKLSLLGFGTMRLPLSDGETVDTAQVDKMVDYALEHGINYFDTAYPYHSGMSERIIGRSLNRYPREQYYLATKYPGHQISSSYDPAAIFEEQLQKCGVDYFDFYLLHNVYENSLKTYLDPKWGIIDYFLEQKRLGRIRHLGFSSHGGVKMLEEFLELYGDEMEFCQIQLNYLDWTLQDAKTKYELLTSRNIPVWVMEPVRGGRLAKLSDEEESRLKALRPEESIAAWSFRFLQGLPNVKMVLSGMSDMTQMEDNVRTFSEGKPLSEDEISLLLDLAEGMKNSVPCTACRYCCDGCPRGLDIPMLIATYNDIRFSPNFITSMRLDALPEDKLPSACIGCGKCMKVCPQNIRIPQVMKEFDEALAKLPSWAEICRQREEAQSSRRR
ncbi:MAG: aldo/keto reductase [Lachnospiraceae bacterium]|nr:aldo/keto reductase [Lachnospiraceae bacterium]